MSLVTDDITPYFIKCIKDIGLFKYVNKPFDQSIPSTIIDRSYTIVFDRISGDRRNMIDVSMIANIYILLYRKGYQHEDVAREEAAKDSERIIKSCIKVANANNQIAIKNVSFRSVDIESLPSNDNIVVSKISFDVLLKMDPNK
jgi:hypothetical protein